MRKPKAIAALLVAVVLAATGGSLRADFYAENPYYSDWLSYGVISSDGQVTASRVYSFTQGALYHGSLSAHGCRVEQWVEGATTGGDYAENWCSAGAVLNHGPVENGDVWCGNVLMPTKWWLIYDDTWNKLWPNWQVEPYYPMYVDTEIACD